jgi:hypothetical protein
MPFCPRPQTLADASLDKVDFREFNDDSGLGRGTIMPGVRKLESRSTVERPSCMTLKLEGLP